jgi:hypothetical protein
MVEESDAHCLLGGFPHASFTPFGFRVLQPPGEVAMVREFMHAYRVIPRDGRPHLDAKTRLYMGDSRGHCEGDTLVVDVTNQKARPWKIAYFYSRVLDRRYEALKFACIEGERDISNP